MVPKTSAQHYIVLCCDNTHNLELCVYVCVCACVCVCVCVCVRVIHIYPCHVHVCNIRLYIHTQDHEASNKSYDAVITRMISNTRFRITFVHKRNCNTLQHTATHCNTLQHAATLHHTATHMSCDTVITRMISNTLFRITFVHKRK